MRAFVVLDFVVFHAELRDWLGRNVSEMTFLCGVGRKNHNSVNQFMGLCRCGYYLHPDQLR